MITVDRKQVAAFAAFFKEAGAVQAFDFCHTGDIPIYPPVGGEGMIEFYFFNAAHQFGFWRLEDDRYAGPMLATVDGRTLKGSDYVSYCLTRAWRKDAGIFAPARVLQTDWNQVFAADSGDNPLPQWSDHTEIIYRYAEWMAGRDTMPVELVAHANASEQPLATFLNEAGQIPGYAEDPLRKKLFLLAIMMENRPEGFLKVTDPESYEPIIDYHLQRSALRCGLIRIHDVELRKRLIARRLVSTEVEREIRQATFDAVQQIVRDSGKSVAAIDYFFFMNRRRCPEMTEPDCAHCPVQTICAQETELFQPVFRTTAY
ncbi:MAG: hypothetical protein M5U15_02565 [Kiritimatiellae bacterium]|nr:hypothetical protein [Kiritimatiellia bacterium]